MQFQVSERTARDHRHQGVATGQGGQQAGCFCSRPRLVVVIDNRRQSPVVVDKDAGALGTVEPGPQLNAQAVPARSNPTTRTRLAFVRSAAGIGAEAGGGTALFTADDGNPTVAARALASSSYPGVTM